MKFIDFVKAYNKGGTWALAIVMVYLFMKAWQNDFVWTFRINVFGEAGIEAIMIILWLISILILTIYDFKENG